MQAQSIDFLIIGAAKSATTWLQKSLQADPSVAMPDPELHYFSRNHHRGLEWYLDQFPPGADDRLAGEKSNSYLDNPVAPPRVHALLPHAKLIVQLRSPVARAYSDYCMLYRRGEVDADIDAHLDTGKGRTNRFLNGGLYHEQLQAYLDLFPAERILVLFYEDMLAAPDAQLRRARSFLGLPAEAPGPILQKVKDRTEPMLSPGLRKAVAPFKPILKRFRGNSVFAAARSLVAHEIAYPALSSPLRQRLVDFYTTDANRLGNLVGRDLSNWVADDAARAH
jgi:hypothetical protein